MEPSRLSAALADRYRIERELGQGGMATVYLAHDIKHDRKVALKVLRPELAATLGPERFVNEIRIAANLTHPHILPVHDSGEASGFLYYVMPYIEGESLRDRLRHEGTLPVPEAARILRDVADALAAAHAKGVVHRDIKPDNVMLSGRHAMVVDFGVAKAVTEATGRQHLTTVGTALGTPHYMSPEQAAADSNIDHRADIYALGIVAYELLTGQPPFSGQTPQQILASHVMTAPAPLLQVRPDLPPALAELVMRCLAKAPGDRWQSANDMARSLESFATPSGGMTPTMTQPLRGIKPAGSRKWVVAGVTMAVVAAAVAVGLLNRPAADETPLNAGLIAIFPFRVTSVDPSLSYLGEGMVDMLSAMYTGEGGPRAIDPRTSLAAWKRHGGAEEGEAAGPAAARDLGAGQYLLGSVVGTGARLVLSASVAHTGSDGQIVLARVEGPADSLSALVESLVGQLLVRNAGLSDERAVGLSSSLEAVRSYVSGRAANRRGDWNAAALHFGRAIALDSNFILATLGMTEASAWMTVAVTGIARIHELAWANRSQLSARDQAVLAGYTGGNGPAPHTGADELAAWESAVSRFPDLAEGWYWLGEAYFHQGGLLGFEDHRARARRAFEMASSLDPDMMAPIYHRTEMAAFRHDTTEARELLATMIAHDSTSESRSILALFVAVGVGDSAEIGAALARFARTGETNVAFAAGTMVENGQGLPWIDTVMSLSRRAARLASVRDRVARTEMSVLLNRGRPQQAIAAARAGGVWDDSTAMATVMYLAAPREAGFEAWQRQSRLIQTPLSPDPAGRRTQYTAACLVGQWNLLYEPAIPVAGILTMLRRGASALDAVGIPEASPTCLAMIEAMQAVHDEHRDRVGLVVRLDSILQTVPRGVYEPVSSGLVGANLVAARLLERIGKIPDAIRAARRDLSRDGNQSMAISVLELGRLAALGGERESAVAQYRHYLSLRWDPEPSMIPQRDSVRAALESLQPGQ